MYLFKNLDLFPKVVQLILAFLTGIILVLLFLANPIANSVISNKLNSEFKENIFVESGDVSINVFSGNIKIERIKIFQITEKDSTGIKKSFDFIADQIIIQDFKMLRFLLLEKIKADSISVYNPEFKLYQLNNDTTKSDKKEIQLNGVLLRRFAIVKGEFSKTDEESNEELLFIHNLNFNLSNFRLPKDSVLSLKTIHFDNIEMSSSNFMLLKNKALYGYSADSVYISTKERKIEINECKIIPQYSK